MAADGSRGEGRSLKEWQRWERMAADFERVGEALRAAESLSMALELLPPGNKQEKSAMLVRLERARAVMVEHGERQARPRGGTARDGAGADERPVEGGAAGTRPSEGPEAPVATGLEPERAREAVMEAARSLCRGLDGAPEEEVLQAAASDLDGEEEAVQEALDDLLDDGLLFRPGPGRLMVDGIVQEVDVEEAVLAAVTELSTGGRGSARAAIIARAASGGIPRREVEEAYNELEESGRIEEDPHGQVRPGMAAPAIAEVRAQVLASVRDMDDDGRGVLRASVVRDLVERGWDVDEVEEAIEELEDAGDVVLEGGSMRAAATALRAEEGAHDRVLAIVTSMTGKMTDGAAGARPADVVRRAGAEGLDPRAVEEAIEDLVDDGALSRDRQGRLRCEATGGAEATSRSVIQDLVRALQRGHQGASRAEVVEHARERGLSEDEAEEALDELLDEGAVHEHGHGFLRPG